MAGSRLSEADFDLLQSELLVAFNNNKFGSRRAYELLTRNSDLMSYTDSKNRSLLHLAADKPSGWQNVIQLLTETLDHEMLTAKDDDGKDALSYLMERRDILISPAIRLLDAGCDPHIRNTKGDTPLHLFVLSLGAKIAQIHAQTTEDNFARTMEEQDLSLSDEQVALAERSRQKKQRHLQHQLIERKRQIKFLLKEGVSPSFENSDGITAFDTLLTIDPPETDLIIHMLRTGADPLTLDKDGNNILQILIQHLRLCYVRFANARYKVNRDAIREALRNEIQKTSEAIDTILKMHPTLAALPNQAGQTPLQQLLGPHNLKGEDVPSIWHFSVATCLVRYGANPNDIVDDDKTVFFMLIHHHYPIQMIYECAQIFIKPPTPEGMPARLGASANFTDELERHALMILLEDRVPNCSESDLVKLMHVALLILDKGGLDPKYKDSHGRYILQLVAHTHPIVTLKRQYANRLRELGVNVDAEVSLQEQNDKRLDKLGAQRDTAATNTGTSLTVIKSDVIANIPVQAAIKMLNIRERSATSEGSTRRRIRLFDDASQTISPIVSTNGLDLDQANSQNKKAPVSILKVKTATEILDINEDSKTDKEPTPRRIRFFDEFTQPATPLNVVAPASILKRK